MRKNNWIVIAVAVVASVALLALWFGLGFNQVDTTLDLVVAALWWVVVAAVIAGIMMAEQKRRQRMRVAFVGDGVLYNAERGIVMVEHGWDEVSTLQRTLDSLSYADQPAELSRKNRPAFRWVVRSRKFDQGGNVWEGEVLPAGNPDAQAMRFNGREELARLLGTAA